MGIEEVGWTQEQLTKAAIGFPALLGYKPKKNLEAKMELLEQWFAKDEVIDLVASCPRVISYSKERIEERAVMLLRKGCLTPNRLKQALPKSPAKFKQWY